MEFIARDAELDLLRRPDPRGDAELIVVHGRRRVGKTALVEHAFKDLWKLEGLEGGDTKAQLEHFLYRLSMYHPTLAERAPLKSWHEALDLLVSLLPREERKRIVIFFDEFQWAAEMKEPLVALMKSFWDNAFSRVPGLKLVLCGSVSSFMVKKVLRSNALYGRVTKEIHLQPFRLGEVKRFFGDQKSADEVVDIALCFGGIPAYLKRLDPGSSLIQNLNQLAFTADGYFVTEYGKLFTSHFGHNPVYRKVVTVLLSGAQTAQQLARACNTNTGGGFTDLLDELCQAGFIERFTPIDKGPTSKLVRYRLHDEYLHLYAKLIHPHLGAIMRGQYRLLGSFYSVPFAQWRGYAFERLLYKNYESIARELGFHGVQYQLGSWFRREAYDQRGAQIDLLFLRADHVATICEAKYQRALQPKALERSMETKIATIEGAFPGYAVQKVLLLPNLRANKTSLNRLFDHILVASRDFID